MISRGAIVVIALAAMVQGAWALSFTVKVDTGAVMLRQSKSGIWTPVKDSAVIGVNDSIFMDDKYGATLTIGKGTRLSLKGETRMCLQGSDTNVAVYLDLGQVLLTRDAEPEVKSIQIFAMGCSFTPCGTAAAVKLTKAHEPSVAVIRGKIRMDSPSGETMVVESGSFGTFSPTTGKFKQGPIPPDAIAFLEKWSSAAQAPVSADNAPTLPKPDSVKQASAVAPENANANAPASSSPTAPQQSAQQQGASPAVTQPTMPQETAPPAKKETSGQPSGAAAKISWEIAAHSVTVDGAQWTLLAISSDIPLWKFGVGLDIECFIDEKGSFSDKGWDFDKKNWKTSLSRKLKYVRFGHENDPFFAKIGGLSNVTLGYGFIVDRFTNLLHYPDQKLLGVQVYLNNIGPLGLTLQTMTPDVMEFNDKGGIFAGRLALCPLKSLSLPLLSALSVGATYAMDINEFAPARSWSFGSISDKNKNGLTDWDYAYQQSHSFADSARVQLDMKNHIVDSANVAYGGIDTVYRDSTRKYALLGGDIGMPVIKNALLCVDVYGQAGVVADSNMFNGKRTGWGFGAPGVRLTTGLLTAQLEYRHVHGRFTPNYFSAYYMDERLIRYPFPPVAKSDALSSGNLDGIFGSIGVNIMNLVMVDGSYQYMAGAQDQLDQRFEAKGSIGDVILKRIPKVNKAEMYFYKTNINRTPVVYKLYKTSNGSKVLPYPKGNPIYDEFFEQTPTLFWGYRIGVEIAKGASLIWDTRYGYQWSSTYPYHLVPYNNISIGTAITF
jgi:hypothetical protein